MCEPLSPGVKRPAGGVGRNPGMPASSAFSSALRTSSAVGAFWTTESYRYVRVLITQTRRYQCRLHVGSF